MPDVDPFAELRSLQVAAYSPGSDAGESGDSTARPRRAAARGGVGAGSPRDPWTSRGQLQAIAVTMLISFVAAFGLMYWQRRAESVAGPERQPEPAARLSSPIPSVASRMTLVPAAAVDENVAKAARRGDSAPSPNPTMPVTVSFVQYNQPSDEDDPDKPSTVFVGRVWNRGTAPLTVSVVRTSANGQSTAQTQLTVDARRVKGFGQNDGVELHAGDTVTLRSDRFADLLVQVH